MVLSSRRTGGEARARPGDVWGILKGDGGLVAAEQLLEGEVAVFFQREAFFEVRGFGPGEVVAGGREELGEFIGGGNFEGVAARIDRLVGAQRHGGVHLPEHFAACGPVEIGGRGAECGAAVKQGSRPDLR